MKKVILLAAGLFAFAALQAQTIRFGLMGAFSSTWMFNNNISDRGDDVNYKSATGSSFGLASTIHFTDESGVALDLLWTTHNAKYQSKDETSQLTDKISYLDIPVLFRLGPSDGGGFVEIGPQFCIVNGVKESYSESTTGLSYSDKDFKKDFSGMQIAAVLGFGYDFEINENWYIGAGLRFGYGFGDFTKKIDETDLAQNDHSLLAGLANYDSNSDYNYSASHRAFGGLHISVLYHMD
jgi:hypothetical protein